MSDYDVIREALNDYNLHGVHEDMCASTYDANRDRRDESCNCSVRLRDDAVAALSRVETELAEARQEVSWESGRDARHDAGYIDRTIATVRQHKGADNPWPGWANALADAVEDERARAEAAEAERDAALGIETEVILDDLRAAEARVTVLEAALRKIAGDVEDKFAEGMYEFQYAIIARAALADGEDLTKEDTDE